MRRFTERFIAWCAEDSAAARFERSVAQAILGIACAGISLGAGAPEWFTVSVAPVIMAVLAPVQHAIGNKGEVE